MGYFREIYVMVTDIGKVTKLVAQIAKSLNEEMERKFQVKCIVWEKICLDIYQPLPGFQLVGAQREKTTKRHKGERGSVRGRERSGPFKNQATQSTERLE